MTPRDLGEAVSFDPGLTVSILRHVNSPFYGLSSRVGSISHAIALLGREELRSLVLAAGTIKAFRQVPVEVLDMASFWNHAIFCALAARALAADTEPRFRDRHFTAGLLHDIGKLVLFSRVPELMRLVLEAIGAAEASYADVERGILGFDHADLGGELLRSWQIPEALYAPVRAHHRPEESTSFPEAAAVLHIADGIASAIEPAVRLPGADGPVPVVIWEGAWAISGLSPQVIETTIAEVGERSLEVFDILTPVPG